MARRWIYGCFLLVNAYVLVNGSSTLQKKPIDVRTGTAVPGRGFSLQPENASVQLGGSVTLQCAANTSDACHWQLDGHVVSLPSDNRRFIGRTVTQIGCSFTIAPFRTTDAGWWRCFLRANSVGRDAVYSRPAHVTVIYGELQDASTQDAAYRSDSYVYLDCKFRNSVSCLWKRRGQRVSISQQSRYHFADPWTIPGHDTKTRDCALRIMNFRPNIDVGQWSCSQMSNSEVRQAQTKIFYLRSQDGQNISTTDIILIVSTGVIVVMVIATVTCFYNKMAISSRKKNKMASNICRTMNYE